MQAAGSADYTTTNVTVNVPALEQLLQGQLSKFSRLFNGV
jgi:hypothetical protein